MIALYDGPPSALSSSSSCTRLLSAIFLRPGHAGGHSRTKLAKNFTQKPTKHYVDKLAQKQLISVSRCDFRSLPRFHRVVKACRADIMHKLRNQKSPYAKLMLFSKSRGN
ncbi:hypothetical protein PoB_005031000 [Plakobranchus ocellatus]|uniref:60S ribosomal protein L36 n=1 Tax=Plakobranchus ocellatus TaxID=259542 RepID=A0AAV4BXC9_9GAST|nr:hypothetical protein PoB_005031000 [Plakobranchus ocellatus]